MKRPRTVRFIIICLFVFGYVGTATSANEPSAQMSMPLQLIAADRAYKRDGPEAFVATLLRGSYPLDTSGDASHVRQSVAVTQLLHQVQEHYGQYQSVEMIAELPIARSTRIVYFVLNHETGPVFGILSLYRSGDAEIITGYAANTELHKIVPLPALADRMLLPQSSK